MAGVNVGMGPRWHLLDRYMRLIPASLSGFREYGGRIRVENARKVSIRGSSTHLMAEKLESCKAEIVNQHIVSVQGAVALNRTLIHCMKWTKDAVQGVAITLWAVLYKFWMVKQKHDLYDISWSSCLQCTIWKQYLMKGSNSMISISCQRQRAGVSTMGRSLSNLVEQRHHHWCRRVKQVLGCKHLLWNKAASHLIVSTDIRQGIHNAALCSVVYEIIKWQKWWDGDADLTKCHTT